MAQQQGGLYPAVGKKAFLMMMLFIKVYLGIKLQAGLFAEEFYITLYLTILKMIGFMCFTEYWFDYKTGKIVYNISRLTIWPYVKTNNHTVTLNNTINYAMLRPSSYNYKKTQTTESVVLNKCVKKSRTNSTGQSNIINVITLLK